jgi:phosphomannomutase
MVNFSIPGRNCSQEQRQDYCDYDEQIHERKAIQDFLLKEFPDLEIAIGGQISLDIYPKGKNKAQALKYLQGLIYFFGDKTEPGGNDYEVASHLLNPPHKVLQVNNWQDTYEKLKIMN